MLASVTRRGAIPDIGFEEDGVLGVARAPANGIPNSPTFGQQNAQSDHGILVSVVRSESLSEIDLDGGVWV